MGKLFVIGTTHDSTCGVVETLESYTPDQLFLEMLDKDVKVGNVSGYSPDFVAAYNWAKERDKAIHGIEFPIDYMLSNIPEGDYRQMKPVQTLCEAPDFRELNQKQYDDMFKTIESKLFDAARIQTRRDGMIANIRRMRDERLTGVVLIGAGNLHYFANQLIEAEFPYRS